MKSFLLLAFSIFAIVKAKAQLFFQNFESSTSLNSYISGQPDAAQFDVAGVTDMAKVVVQNGKLKMTKKAGGNERPYILRTTPLVTNSQFLSFSFKISVKAEGDATAYLCLGNSFENNALPDSLSKTYVRFLLHLLPNGFSIRNSNQAQEGTNKYTGEQHILLVMNNSGKPQIYTGPDNSEQKLDNDRWDLWVGNIQEFKAGTCTSYNQTINNFKFSLLSSISEVTLDDITIRDMAK